MAHEEPEVSPVSPPIERTDRLHPIRITSVSAEHPGTGERPYVTTGEPLTVTLHFTSLAPTDSASFVVEFRNETGTVVLRTVSGDLGQHLEVPAGAGTVSFRYESFPFLDGAYDVSVGVEHRAGGQLYDWKEGAFKVEVMNPTKTVGLVTVPVSVWLAAAGPAGLSVPVSSLPTVSVRAEG
jgi:hypothetical protein